MLLSMTGFGEAHRKNGSMAISVEVRTINSRYFKLVDPLRRRLLRARAADREPGAASTSSAAPCRFRCASTGAMPATIFA